MPEPLDFETVRWKTADDMQPEEIDLIVANKDKLNEEEKAAFANLLQVAEPLSDDPLSDAINRTVDEPVVPEATPPVEATPVTPAAPVVPATPAIPTVPQTQEQLDAYLEKKKQEWDAAGKTAAEVKTETDKIEKLFEDGFKPDDWNDYTTKMLEKAFPIIEKRILDRLSAEEREKAETANTLQAERKRVYEAFEAEFKDLSTKKLIPDPTVDADGYKKVHDQIIALGDANGKRNITEAYNLWKIIPEEHGGGLKIGAGTPDPAVEAQRAAAQKAAAGKIGKGAGAATPPKAGARDWNSIHSTNMDDLIEERLLRN